MKTFYTVLFGLVCLFPEQLSAQVPRLGKSNQLELASWNITWFGDPGQNPADDQLQYKRVKEAILGTDFDVWALQEISNENLFNSLIQELGGYSHALATYSQTQKTALIWKTAEFQFIKSEQVLGAYQSDFANGRTPLAVDLLEKATGDTLHFLVIHLKAHTGTTTEKRQSYTSRKKCGEHLKNYLEGFHDRNMIVIGDWNDDVDYSVLSDSTTPFRTLLDHDSFTFVLQARSALGERSYVHGTHIIDHILINARMKSRWISNSPRVYYLELYIPNYVTTVSDHDPVYSFFRVPQKLPNQVSEPSSSDFSWYPNPSSGFFHLTIRDLKWLQVFGSDGRELELTPEIYADGWRIYLPASGIYHYRLQTGNQIYSGNLLVNQ